MPRGQDRIGSRQWFTGVLASVTPNVPVPRAFFTDILPGVSTIEELQVTLVALRLFDEAGGYDSPVAERSIVRDSALRTALRIEGSPREPDKRIAQGLELAVARGTLLRLITTSGRKRVIWYYVNTPDNRASVGLMERGQLAVPEAVWIGDTAPEVELDRPNAFRLYEQNIGPLTPLVADQIGRALEEYPADWIEDAMDEAVSYNRRSWRYMARILETWSVQGRGDRDN
ncbi:MAG: DnaD/phage-associated domain protein [uncultured Thermomicrobiales bacterium]|uniref:DnaD/phage-associated domain protein n=1 Tax=uncultured Thermomicrobiales bacterium TaxID=1645740 RepID=A0A6J4VSB9_9BACT|nr:MAG: DnaD/phage-associated domain protein [uncultured Thermomicrobiales bacterium]